MIQQKLIENNYNRRRIKKLNTALKKEGFLQKVGEYQYKLMVKQHKQEEEVIEFGYPKTTCYYPDLNSLKEIDFKEDKQLAKKKL